MSALPATFVKGFHDEELCRRMEYRTLGKTGLQVSKVGLGCATLSDLFGELDVNEAVKTVHQAIKSGINYLDTAPFYGQGRSEQVLGLALKDVPREAYYIATKVGRYHKSYDRMFDFSATRTRESVEQSLKLLGLDYVDVIQIHDFEYAQDIGVLINECLPELEKFVKEGKAKFIGVTGYSLSGLKECIERASGRFDVILSYARNTLMDDTLKAYIADFQKTNVGIVCAAAHALGLLTNAGPPPWHFADTEQLQLCRKAANICKESGVELGKLAMWHTVQLNGPATFLIGMQTRQLLAINLGAYYDGLSQTEQEVLQLLRKTIFTKSLNWDGVEMERFRAANQKN